jgi:membrane protein implicated in regulation of membrane protease activity
MSLEPWHLWIIVAIILFIVEIFTPALLAICLAIGCLAFNSIGGVKDSLTS